MISSKRVATIFETKGGNGAFTKTFDALSDSEKGQVMGVVKGDNPLIASFLSSKEWFIVTDSSFILNQRGRQRSISLEKIARVKRPGGRSGFSSRKAS